MAYTPVSGEPGQAIGSGTLTAGAGQYDVIKMGRRDGREELTQVEVFSKAPADLRLAVPIPGGATYTQGRSLATTAATNATGTLPVTGSLTLDTDYDNCLRVSFMWPKEAALLLVNNDAGANAYVVNMRQDPM